jgi:subtilisin
MGAAVLLASGVALAQTVPEAKPDAAPQTGAPAGEVVPGEYIVVLEDQPTGDFSAQAADAARQMAQRHKGLRVKQTYQYALKGFAARIPQGELDEVRSDPAVLFVSKNREFELAPFEPGASPTDFAPAQGDPHQEQVLDHGVDRIEADQSSASSGDGTGSVDVGMAIIDTGIDQGHEDLNVVGGTDCGSSSGAFSDEVGHGTFVAGMAAAEDNDIGVVGVAPGAPLYSVKVADRRGLITTAMLLCGLDWVTANAEQIEVANMSIGGPIRDADDGACGLRNADALHYAICRSVEEGITYAIAAFNFRANIKNAYPAAYDEVLTAAAMADTDGEPGGQGPRIRCWSRRLPAERDDTKAEFSNFATPASADAGHTIAAPGVCVTSTLPDDNYGSESGTSFSSPLVAGTAALYKQQNPDATPEEVMEALLTEASEQPPSYGFNGDPHRPIRGRYYGYLVYAGDF